MRGFGIAHAPSPDAHSGHRGLRSLDAACAPPSMAPLAGNAGSRSTGDPSLKSGEGVRVNASGKSLQPGQPV